MRFKKFFFEDMLPGGKGDNLKISDVDPISFEVGCAIESEHTSDPEIQSEIVRDHFSEDKNYYRRLLKYIEPEEINSLLKKINISRSELLAWIAEI